ncbi:MAG: hypothetical protein ABJB86_19245 [Bacteroidota bacterium]
MMTSCVKSLADPQIPDSLFVITGLSIFVGGDSTQWNVSTRNSFLYDSVQGQLIQTITESSFGDPNTYTYHTTYQYDNAGKLKEIHFERFSFIYKSMRFEYNADGTVMKALFTNQDNVVIENSFNTSSSNGNIIITQYDTLPANIGKGEYFSSRPAILRYTFNGAGKLVNQYIIGSELYNGQPAYRDTSEKRFTYDENNHLLQTIHRSIATDNQSNYVLSMDTVQFKRDNSMVSPVNDLALATLRNLHWLKNADNVNLYNGLYALNYGTIHRNEPLTSTYEVFNSGNYAAAYTNSFDTRGLLTKSAVTTTEHNIYNISNTTRETHYYTYNKIKK